MRFTDDEGAEKLRRGLYEGAEFEKLLGEATPQQRREVLGIITTDTDAAFRHGFNVTGFPARMEALFNSVEQENHAAAHAVLPAAAALANPELFAEFLLKRISDKQLRHNALLTAVGGDSSITPSELEASKNIENLLWKEGTLPKPLLFKALETAVTTGNARQLEVLANYAKAKAKRYPGLLDKQTEGGNTLINLALAGVAERGMLRDESGAMVEALINAGARVPPTVTYADPAPVTENIIDYMHAREFREQVIRKVAGAISSAALRGARPRDEVSEVRRPGPAKVKPASDTPREGQER